MEKKVNPLKESHDFYKRIPITIGILCLWKLLSYIPLPFINFEALSFMFSTGPISSGFSRFSVVALGLMPFISAYIIAEVSSLVVPKVKAWRREGLEGRKKIRWLAYVLTLILGFLQAYGLVYSMSHLPLPGGVELINIKSASYFVMTITLLSGTFLIIYLAHLITEKGFGHGVSLLFLADFCDSFFGSVKSFYLLSKLQEYQWTPFEACIYPGLIFASIALIVLIETARREYHVKIGNDLNLKFPFKLTTAGVIPFKAGVMIATTFMSITQFYPDSDLMQWMVSHWNRGSPLYLAIHSGIIVLSYFFLTAIFYNPSKIIDAVKNVGGELSLDSKVMDAKIMDRKMIIYAIVGTIYVLIFYLIKNVQTMSYYVFAGSLIIVSVVICMDLLEEYKFRKKHGKLVALCEMHDVPLTGLLQNIIRENGIPCFVKGYYHRSVLYFFGPYIDMGLYVPKDKEQHGLELLIKYKSLIK